MGKQRRFTIYRAVELQVRYATGFCSEPSALRIWPHSHPSTPRRACFHGHTGRGKAAAQFVVLVIQFEETYIRMQTSTSLRSLAVMP